MKRLTWTISLLLIASMSQLSAQTSEQQGSSHENGVIITVNIKTLTGKIHPLKVKDNSTIKDLKKLMEKDQGILAKQQRLIFGGKQLDDDKTLKDYNIKDKSTVFLVLKLG